MYDGIVIKNETDHRAVLVPYRPDGGRIKSYTPSIGPKEMRLINNDHLPDADFYFVLAYLDGANIPEFVDVKSATHSWSFAFGLSGSGSVGGTGGGGGISFGGGEGTTDFYSSYMCGAIIPLEKNANGKYGSNRLGCNNEYKLSAYDQKVFFNQQRNFIQIADEEKEKKLIVIDTKLWCIEFVGERPKDDQRKTYGW